MKLKFANALSLALILAMLFTSVGLADNTVADGDGVTPVVDNNLSFGTVCAGSTTTKTVLIAVSRNGNGTNVFKNGSTVTVSVLSVTGTGLSASMVSPATIAIPSNWGGQDNNVLSDPVSSTVKLIAGGTGSFSGKVTYRGAGVNGSNASINRDDDMIVTANVVNCDNTPPTLNLPNDITVEATGPSGEVITYSATATDANPATPSVTCDPASGSTFTLGTTTVNCSATDAAGNTAEDSFLVKVVDTTAPDVTPPSDITVEAVNASGAMVTYEGESAEDLVDGSLPVSCEPPSGSTFELGSTSVICSATDEHGNTGTASFNVTVEDTTAPILGLPDEIIEEATGPNGAPVIFSVSASDTVHGNVPVSCDADSGDIFPLGTTEVSCSATDSNDNIATSSFNVTVVDTTAPSLDLPASFSLEATGPTGAAATFSASASDIVDGSVPVVCDADSGDTFPLGINTVECSATDEAGNVASGSFDITVVDTTAPDLTLPADQLLEATGPNGAVATFTASASDSVDGSVPVVCDHTSGSTFPLGTTAVNCSVSDAAGNEASGSFDIIVQDTIAPALTLPDDITKEATGPSGAVVTYNASANDLVDGSVTVSCTPASGLTFPLGTTTVSCSAADSHGNGASDSFTVTVQDTTAPTLSLPANISAFAAGNSSATVTYTASATDLVDGPVAVSCLPASGFSFPVGTTTVNCSATDAHGNTANGNFKVTVSYGWLGFFQPVDNLPVLNKAKAGSAIPVKFSLSGYQGLNIFAAGSPTSAVTACNATANEDAIESILTASNSGLTYDAAADQYVYVWKTDKTWAGTCRTLTVKLADGTIHQANFTFTK